MLKPGRIVAGKTRVMTASVRLKMAFAACVGAALLTGCSLAEPRSHDFVLVEQRPAKAEETGNTLEAAKSACKEETRRRGLSSIVGIFSRLRPGGADKDYIACMRGRGFEVAE